MCLCQPFLFSILVHTQHPSFVFLDIGIFSKHTGVFIAAICIQYPPVSILRPLLSTCHRDQQQVVQFLLMCVQHCHCEKPLGSFFIPCCLLDQCRVVPEFVLCAHGYLLSTGLIAATLFCYLQYMRQWGMCQDYFSPGELFLCALQVVFTVAITYNWLYNDGIKGGAAF